MPEAFQHPKQAEMGKSAVDEEAGAGQEPGETNIPGSLEKCVWCVRRSGNRVRTDTAGFGHEAITGHLDG